MPELPEVEYNRQIINRSCLGLSISKVNCLADDKVFNVDSKTVESILSWRRIKDTGRHGKYFWFSLDNGAQMLIHLGMTGFVQVRGKLRSIYKSAPEKAQSDAWPPRFTKLTLVFEDDSELVYGDSRRFGRIRFFSSASERSAALSDLGFDPILSPIASAEELPIGSRRVPIKSLLLEQSFCAGIGNWMADDILYHSGIHPKAIACELSQKERQQLWKAIVYISSNACELRLKDLSYPPEWLFHCRWDAGKKKSLVHCGEAISVIRIAGRTTLFSPSQQKLK